MVYRVSVRWFLFIPLLAPAFGYTSLTQLSLVEAEEIALECNRAFLISQEETTQAYERKWQALSRWFPSIKYSAEYHQSQLPELTEDVYSDTLPLVKRSYSSIFELTQPIFSTNLFFGFKAKTFENRAYQEAEEQLKNGLLFAVRRSYYAVLLFEESIRIQKDNVDYLTYALQQEEGKLRAKDATTLEVNQSRVAVANALTLYYSALKQAKTARGALILALGINPLLEPTLQLQERSFPLHSIPEIQEKIEQFIQEKRVLFSSNEIDHYIAQALQQRPDLKQKQSEIAVANETLHSKQGNYLPEVGGYVRYSYNDNILGSIPFNSESYHWVGGVRLSWKLFDSFLREHEVKEARSAKRASLLQWERVQNQIEVEIRDSLYHLEETLLSYLSSREAVQLATQAREQAQEKLKYGKIAPLEYRDSVNALSQARNQNNQASFELVTAYYQLRYAMGSS